MERWAGPLPPSDARLWSKKHSPSGLCRRRGGGLCLVGIFVSGPSISIRAFMSIRRSSLSLPQKLSPQLQGEKHFTPQDGDQPCFVFAVAWLGAQLNCKSAAG